MIPRPRILTLIRRAIFVGVTLFAKQHIDIAIGPARLIIAEHHEAIAARITALLQRVGHPMPGEASDQLMVAYVGALSWGHVGDPVGASVAFRRSVERVLDTDGRATRP